MISHLRLSGTDRLTAPMHFLKQSIQIYITNSLSQTSFRPFFQTLLSDPCTSKILRYCEINIYVLPSSDLKSCMIRAAANEHSLISVVRVCGGVWGVRVMVLNDWMRIKVSWPRLFCIWRISLAFAMAWTMSPYCSQQNEPGWAKKICFWELGGC